MVVGVANPNIVMPVTKLCITNKATGKKTYVLYNPESYVLQRGVSYGSGTALGANMPALQFTGGSPEELSMQLFFDTFSSGAEVGGSAGDKLKFAANSLLPSAAKMDVRKYTDKIYQLMLINASTHAPPLLKLEWGSLQFTGFLVECTQRFTKFSETGVPVRATLEVKFREHKKPTESAALTPKESPDTAKYRIIHQGDALWAFAGKEYGQCSQWRAIAQASGVDNPRLLESGSMLQLPALP